MDIIQRIAQLTGHPPDLADDAYWNPNTRQILTTDLLVESRHFSRAYCSPEDIGWKAAAVNISDIAGMGGQPESLLVSLGLPNSIGLPWVERLYSGILSCCTQYGCRLVGGDTVSSDCVIINVTAVGSCREGHHVGRRMQAQAGDWIIATGYHGLSAVGLQVLQGDQANYDQAKSAHRRPQPRVTEGLLLSRYFSRYALMDSSDGLADALIKIATASNVKLIANRAKIPLHPEVKAFAQMHQRDPVELALYGGEDFQLVATVPPNCLEQVPNLLASFHVVGRVEDGEPGAWLETPGDKQLIPLRLEQTYQHFSEHRHD